MHDYWLIKKERQKSQTPETIIDLYDHLYGQNLIYGGKLVGAGGSGFILFATKNPNRLRSAMLAKKVKELNFDMCNTGLQSVVI